MLVTRIITALILLPLVVGAILFLPTAAIAAVAAAVLLVGAWEWGTLARFAAPARAAYTAAAAAVLALAWLTAAKGGAAGAVLGAAIVWWLAAVFWVRRFPRGWEATLGRRPVAAALGLLVLAATFLALVRIHPREQGPVLLLLLFVLIWVADTGAYVAGHIRGRRKLAPRVSPGKTLEGALGGVVLTTAAAAGGGLWLDHAGAGLLGWSALGAAVASVSIVGDLTISMFKRSAGVKDAGRLFPGHGGVLDRLDSLIAAAPVYAVGLVFLMG